MKTYFYAVLAGLLLGALPGRAQVQLPPGTRMPGPSLQEPGTSSAAAELDSVEDEIQQGNYEKALPAVEKYLQAHPKDARALFDLGYVDQAENHIDDAVTEYREAIAAEPKQFESRLALGLILAHQGKSDEARRQLQQATQLTPAAPNFAAQAEAFRVLAELDLAVDPVAAKEALLSALKISPETPHDMLLTAQIAEAAGDDDTAGTAYRRVLDGHPSPELATQAASGLSHILLRQKRYSDAEAMIQDGLKLAPDDVALNAQMATALIAQNKKAEALPVLAKLRQLQPGDLNVDQMLADAYSQLGQPEKAGPIYAEMVKAQPENAEFLTSQGRNFILEKQFSQAQQAFEGAVKRQPDDSDAWTGLAFAAVKNKQYPAALNALSMRAKYLPETAASYFLWAISYDNVHQIRSAEEYYRKFLASDQGKLRDQEWQAKQRLAILERTHR